MTKLEERTISATEKAIEINVLLLRLNLLHTRPDVVKQFYSREELLLIFGSMEKYNEYLMLGKVSDND